VPVQFSCHVLGPGGLQHHEWIAHGTGDPRGAIALAVIAACAGASTVAAYSDFELKRLKSLIEAVPDLAVELEAIVGRLRDLLPVVRDHVYHPDFHGSFSIKAVLPALVPGLGYDDLAIQEGGSASAALEMLLLHAGSLTDRKRMQLRSDLLRYCERDTLAMVRLYERLRSMSDGLPGRSPTRPRRTRVRRGR
jgi:hypothetical protein